MKPGRTWSRNVAHVAFAVLVAFAMSTVAAGNAEAKRKKRRAKVAKINEKALGELRGDFKFGMSKKEVLTVLRNQIKDKFADKIAKTNDVYEQDKLRRLRGKELDRIKKSYVEFKGKKTGWDVSIVDDQFAHNTDESMMIYWEVDPATGSDQRRFFFFHAGELYKMFIALNSDSLQPDQRNFEFLQNVMQRRFGGGSVKYDTDRDGNKTPSSIEWSTSKFHGFAINKMDFYGSFCLGIADRAAERRIAEARAAVPKAKRSNALINSVIEKTDETPSLDEGNANVVDQLIR